MSKMSAFCFNARAYRLGRYYLTAASVAHAIDHVAYLGVSAVP